MLDDIWDGLLRADPKRGAFFVEDARKGMILFEPGGYDGANLRLLLARVGPEETARLVYVQTSWDDRARREALVIPWEEGSMRLMMPKKDLQVEAVGVATFFTS
ncbi:hypothetical protein BH09SUM1_BH09SUM1_01070 [soil metagenome]